MAEAIAKGTRMNLITIALQAIVSPTEDILGDAIGDNEAQVTVEIHKITGGNHADAFNKGAKVRVHVIDLLPV